MAWEGNDDHAGVRFKNASDEQISAPRQWLSSQLPEVEPDDPPVTCHLTDLSLGGCYLTTVSPFPRGTRVALSIKTSDLEVHAEGVVLVAHPEFGMGVEFLQTTNEQRNQVHGMITMLRANPDKSPELQVEPQGLETSFTDGDYGKFQVLASPSPGEASASETSESMEGPATDDPLVDLFRQKFEMPVDTFLERMREQRQTVESHSN